MRWSRISEETLKKKKEPVSQEGRGRKNTSTEGRTGKRGRIGADCGEGDGRHWGDQKQRLHKIGGKGTMENKHREKELISYRLDAGYL